MYVCPVFFGGEGVIGKDIGLVRHYVSSVFPLEGGGLMILLSVIFAGPHLPQGRSRWYSELSIKLYVIGVLNICR